MRKLSSEDEIVWLNIPSKGRVVPIGIRCFTEPFGNFMPTVRGERLVKRLG